MREDLPYPRNDARKLPVVLSPEEVARLIDCARNLYHRALLMTVYSCGLRRIEACRLKVGDIDSQRMMIRITQGKGGVDREVPLSPALLETLRQYWRWMRPKTYLFPGTENGWRVDKPITAKMVWAGGRLRGQAGRHSEAGLAAYTAPQLRDAPTGSRCGPENAAGPFGPPGSRNHLALSPPFAEAPPGGHNSTRSAAFTE